LSLACVGCGSSSSHNLSPAQAQAVAQELTTALGAALSSGLGNIPADTTSPQRLPAIVHDLHPYASTGCTITNGIESCNIPVTYSGPCPSGGTIGVTGDFVFTLDSSGNGSDNSTLTVMPTNCAVSNTTFNGDPNVTVGINLGFQNYGVAFPATFTETGGISFGPNPKGSCTLNVNVSITSATTCTVTGTICGQSVTGGC
jgi:hypothetical protein